LEPWAREQAEQSGFMIDEIIYRADYYETGKERNIIFSGKYRNSSAVFKAYNDPRLTDEPVALKNFLDANQSNLLFAPKLYAYKMVGPKKGWLIMERLPSDGYFLESPLTSEQRQVFLTAFQEYLNNWPRAPSRDLTIIEKMSAFDLHQYRIHQWLALAMDKEERNASLGSPRALDADAFIERYRQAIDLLRRTFKDKPMYWCHGHVKPKEIYVSANQQILYLTDFAHTKMYPLGYEFAFIIWADYLMAADWTLPYSEWRKGVFSWIEDLQPIAQEQGIENFSVFIKVCLLERILGAILADICASDRPLEEKTVRLNLLCRLFDELLA